MAPGPPDFRCKAEVISCFMGVCPFGKAEMTSLVGNSTPAEQEPGLQLLSCWRLKSGIKNLVGVRLRDVSLCWYL